MKIMKKNHMKIKTSDWKYLQAALVCYILEPFQSHELQSKVKILIEKYTE